MPDNRARGRKKITVLALGAVGLAGALTLAALVAPSHAARQIPSYTPARADQVIARVPARDPAEVAARRALAASPERVELAVELARADVQRYRTLADPRYLGRAQATLARWWQQPQPPLDVLLLRATIRQSIHEFTAARADLDQLVTRRPDDTQGHLIRAVVATITADYDAARASCAAVRGQAGPLLAAACEAPLEGIAGRADQAYPRLRELVAHSRGSAGVRGWALTALAELAFQRGDNAAAADHLVDALALDPDDGYARNLLADLHLAGGRPGAAIELLDGRDAIDGHLVRLAIAEHQRRGANAGRHARAMRERIAAAAERGDRIHLREEARFALAVDNQPARAVGLARDNWDVQRELADARLLAECAAAARDPGAAAPVIEWARRTGVRDVQLERWLAELGAAR